MITGILLGFICGVAFGVSVASRQYAQQQVRVDESAARGAKR